MAEEESPVYTLPPLLFFGPYDWYGWLSNWSPHGFTDGAMTFPTAEHYLMYKKAELMGDNVRANHILSSTSPAQVKRLGRQIKPWNEKLWIANRQTIMFMALMRKTYQNQNVYDALMATGNRHLAKAAPLDAVWGIGLGAGNPKAQDPKEWRGLNELGVAWMRVRKHARENLPPKPVA